MLKLKKIYFEIEHVNVQSTELQKTFDLIKQTEEIIEPYPADNSELSDIENPKSFFIRYHAAYFSSANMQWSLKTRQHK